MRFMHLVFVVCGVWAALWWSPLLLAQSLHTPAQVTHIMEHSRVQYMIDTVSPGVGQRLPLVPPVWRVGDKGDVLPIQSIDLTHKAAKKYHKKALKYAKKNRHNRAAGYYRKALTLERAHPALLKGLASSLLIQKKYVAAQQAYEQLIAHNRIDFEAHHHMSLIYKNMKLLDKAVYHVTMAHLLNRNDSLILVDLRAIYLENGVNYGDWGLVPHYQITADSVGSRVRVRAEQVPWLAYACCKALWLYEPDYSERTAKLYEAERFVVEEKECLLNALLAYEGLAEDKRSFPALKHLGVALAKRQVDDFIWYELFARRQPLSVSKLPIERLEQLVKYVSVVRPGL